MRIKKNGFNSGALLETGCFFQQARQLSTSSHFSQEYGLSGTTGRATKLAKQNRERHPHSRQHGGAPAHGFGRRDQALCPSGVFHVELLGRRCALSGRNKNALQVRAGTALPSETGRDTCFRSLGHFFVLMIAKRSLTHCFRHVQREAVHWRSTAKAPRAPGIKAPANLKIGRKLRSFRSKSYFTKHSSEPAASKRSRGCRC